MHSPGTVLNDQFKDDWDGYLSAIESASPVISAIGLTDYCCLRGYKQVLAKKQAGRLPSVQLLFPNIELRLAVQTEARGAINIHLLVSPETKDHVERIEELLGKLSFSYSGEEYSCSEASLMRLGRVLHGEPQLPDAAALSKGAGQFKVAESELFDLENQSAWFRDNVLIATAAGADGLGGLKETSFTAKRQEIGRRSHLIFSGTPSNRKFWAGHHPDFAKLPYSPKPCIHGSDCHSLESVGNPAQGRSCWIRAEVSFEGLRQVIAEPERRVHIGPAAPLGPNASDTITRLTVENAAWLGTSEIEFNRGLVTVIGMKGSGKTALADLVAAAAGASEDAPGPASFIRKAEPLLNGQTATLEWADGTTSSVKFGDEWREGGAARVCYLSQQFVDQLCSPSGEATSPLLVEIERVVFEAIPPEDRLGAVSFEELRSLELRHLHLRQEEAKLQVVDATKIISDEGEKRHKTKPLENRLKEIGRQLVSVRKELKKLPVSGNKQHQNDFDKVSREGRRLTDAIAGVRRKEKKIEELRTEFSSYATSIAGKHASWRKEYADLLSDGQWSLLVPVFGTPPAEVLDARVKELEAERKALEEKGVETADGDSKRSLATLKAEHLRFRKLIGLDESNAKKRDGLNERVVNLEAEQKKVTEDLADVKKAGGVITAAQADRMAAYESLFTSIVEEVEVLERLYAPLSEALAADRRLEHLSFHVLRSANPSGWAARGEDFLDLRKSGRLQGRGALLEAAQSKLLPYWQTGTPQAVRAAMDRFYREEGRDALGTIRDGHTVLEFADWLFSTDHVHVEYGIRYGGVTLDRLSPGTRGIVLLTLYLGLDKWDTRPLVIDQPEENLDPQSIYDELVGFFRTASERRQIIMVTHNANLVVNTDSDQVIVASSTRTSPEGLPTVSYAAGPLEDSVTKECVCRILEGGERAFRRRGQRYGLVAALGGDG